MFGGRDVRFSRRVAEETGLQVVPCTGIYTYDYLPPYFMFRDEDAMADLFVHDIEQGIQGTDTRAAFLKCAADEPGVAHRQERGGRMEAWVAELPGFECRHGARPVQPKRVVLAVVCLTDDEDLVRRQREDARGGERHGERGQLGRHAIRGAVEVERACWCWGSGRGILAARDDARRRVDLGEPETLGRIGWEGKLRESLHSGGQDLDHGAGVRSPDDDE